MKNTHMGILSCKTPTRSSLRPLTQPSQQYCAPGHTGPLCAVCEKRHFKDDGSMCKACPSSGIPTETFTAPFFILVYCTCALALIGMVRACACECVCEVA